MEWYSQKALDWIVHRAQVRDDDRFYVIWWRCKQNKFAVRIALPVYEGNPIVLLALCCLVFMCLYVPRLLLSLLLQWRSCRAVRSVMDAALVRCRISAAIENVQLVARGAPSPRVGYARLSLNFILAALVYQDIINSSICKM